VCVARSSSAVQQALRTDLCSSSCLGVLRGSAWIGCILAEVTGLLSRLRLSSPMHAILELCVSP
jgi:hypothetical protein